MVTLSPIEAVLRDNYDIKDPLVTLQGFYSNLLYLTPNFFVKVTPSLVPESVYGARLRVVEFLSQQ